jgi:conjugative relaxase-like TrwC/TraI family protein
MGARPFAGGGERRVLTIGKLGVSRGQLEYYDAQVAAGAEDYYAGRGESPGRWRGAGALALGLVVGQRVERSGFMALMRGRNPVDGAVLREMGKRSTVAALDLTFSAPKSVSVLFAVGDEEISGALLAAHEQAVDAALAYLEREACLTRRGRDGTERLRGEGFIAASYRHRMSRAGDPQLHTHVVVGNLTRAGGRYTALDARALYEHKSAGGAVYRAVLRAEVCRRLAWVSWRLVGRGLFEINGVGEDVLSHFSKRRVEIIQRAVELVGAGAGELSRERMQGIALQTRKAKRYGIDGGTWRDEVRARAAEHGLGEQELEALRRGMARTPAAPAGKVAARLSGPLGLTELHNTFARRHALAEIAGAFHHGASVEELDTVTSDYLADPTVRHLRPEEDEERYTTSGLLACEQQILDGAERRRTEGAAVLTAGHVESVLGSWNPALNDDQASVVRAITSGGHGIEAVAAVAGSGKTTMIGALAACYAQDGWNVLGAAPTGRAARQLREAAGVPAETMHTMLLRLARTGGFQARTVLVLDEAGMAPTRLAARLFSEAERAGAKVVAVGDPGQLGSVQAGGWLAALTASSDQGPSLREAIRQHDVAEREALRALHDGDAGTYVEHMRQRIIAHEQEHAAIRALVAEWNDGRARHGTAGAAMIARDNYTRELANRAARTQLQAAGELPAVEVLIGGRAYARGDRVIARRNDRHHDLDNGTLATVAEIDPATGAMIVQTDAGEPRALAPSYVADHLEHAYALTAHGAQGGTFQWAGVIGRPEEFTREWAYTALSRARGHTSIHLIAEPPERARERDEYAPPAPRRQSAEVRDALQHAMRRSEVEALATAHLRQGPAHEAGASDHQDVLPAPIDPAVTDPRNPDPSLANGIPAERTDPATAERSATRLKGLERLRRHSQQRRGPTLGL